MFQELEKRNTPSPYDRPRMALFPLGEFTITPAASAALSHADVLMALREHLTGNWGYVGADAWSENDTAAREGGRVLSAHRASTGARFLIATEADRSRTTVFLPHEA